VRANYEPHILMENHTDIRKVTAAEPFDSQCKKWTSCGRKFAGHKIRQRAMLSAFVAVRHGSVPVPETSSIASYGGVTRARKGRESLTYSREAL
jgi:hypothetical protein